jgi:hypothetical protein
VFEYVVEVRWSGKGPKQAVEVCLREATAEDIAWWYRDEGHSAEWRGL